MFAQISHDPKYNKLESVLKSVFREGHVKEALYTVGYAIQQYI